MTTTKKKKMRTRRGMQRRLPLVRMMRGRTQKSMRKEGLEQKADPDARDEGEAQHGPGAKVDRKRVAGVVGVGGADEEEVKVLAGAEAMMMTMIQESLQGELLLAPGAAAVAAAAGGSAAAAAESG